MKLQSAYDECLLLKIIIPENLNAKNVDHGFLIAKDIRSDTLVRVLFNAKNIFKIV